MTAIQESLYEHLFPLTTIMKQRVVDNFDGDTLNERWTQRIIDTAPTFAMVDAIDEGFSILTATVSDDGGALEFNNIRHYLNTASIVLGVIRPLQTTSIMTYIGFYNTRTGFGGGTQLAEAGFDTFSDTVNFTIRTGDASATSVTSTTVVADTTFRLHQVELTSANSQYSINGNLEVTKTTNRPTIRLQPFFVVLTRTTAAREGRIRYLEAYNT